MNSGIKTTTIASGPRSGLLERRLCADALCRNADRLRIHAGQPPDSYRGRPRVTEGTAGQAIAFPAVRGSHQPVDLQCHARY